MNETTKKILIKNGLNIDDFDYVDKTCDNIKLRHKKTGRIFDLRW